MFVLLLLVLVSIAGALTAPTITVGQSCCRTYPCGAFSGVFYGFQAAFLRMTDNATEGTPAIRLISLDNRNSVNLTQDLLAFSWAVVGETQTTAFWVPSNSSSTFSFAPTFGAQALRVPWPRKVVNVRASFYDEIDAALQYAEERSFARVGLLYLGDAAGQDISDAFNALRDTSASDTRVFSNIGYDTLLAAFSRCSALILALDNQNAPRFALFAQTKRPELHLILLSVVEPVDFLVTLNHLNGSGAGISFTTVVPVPSATPGGMHAALALNFSSAITKYFPAQRKTLLAFEGFIAGTLFELVVAKAMRSGSLTQDAFLETLYKRGTWEIGNLTLGPFNSGNPCNSSRGPCGCNQGLRTVWVYDLDDWSLVYWRNYSSRNCGKPLKRPGKGLDIVTIIAIAASVLTALIVAILIIAAIIQRRRGRKFISLTQEQAGSTSSSKSFEPFFLACAKEVLSTTQYLPLLEAAELEGMDLVGVGSTAKVYRATWRGVTVAVKQLHYPLELCMDTMITELANEIKLWSQLIHPHIVQFLGVTKDLWLIMEFMEHGTLRNAVKNRDISLHHRIVLMHQVSLAMGYLHSRKIVHRDLNPNNVMVTGTATSLEAKLADFGLSRIEAANLSKTASVGTPVYAAPEVLSKGQYSAKSDVYSFALTLWFALNKEEPFSFVKNPFELIRAVSIEKRRPPLGRVPDLHDLIESAWADDPSSRPDFEVISSTIHDHLAYEGQQVTPGSSDSLHTASVALLSPPTSSTKISPPPLPPDLL